MGLHWAGCADVWAFACFLPTATRGKTICDVLIDAIVRDLQVTTKSRTQLLFRLYLIFYATVDILFILLLSAIYSI
jgi:hypothetical protein